MYRKLIAVGLAAALALSGSLALPANASSSASLSGIEYEDWAENQTWTTTSDVPSTADRPAGVFVPANNELDEVYPTVLRVVVGTQAKAKVKITTNGAVRAIRSIDGLDQARTNIDATKLGGTVPTYDAFGLGNLDPSNSFNDDFFVFTTSTTAGSFTVSITTSGTSYERTHHIQGITGSWWVHSIDSVSAPSVLKRDDTGYLTFRLKDVFGNPINDFDAFGVVSDQFGGGHDFISEDTNWLKADFDRAPATSSTGWHDATQSYKVEMLSFTDDPFVVTIDQRGIQVPGFPKPSNRFALVVNGGAGSDLVAKLEKIIERKVSRKKYNKLARMWNADNPDRKVKLK